MNLRPLRPEGVLVHGERGWSSGEVVRIRPSLNAELGGRRYSVGYSAAMSRACPCRCSWRSLSPDTGRAADAGVGLLRRSALPAPSEGLGYPSGLEDSPSRASVSSTARAAKITAIVGSAECGGGRAPKLAAGFQSVLAKELDCARARVRCVGLCLMTGEATYE